MSVQPDGGPGGRPALRSGERFLIGWLSVQWVAFLLAALPIGYMFFSDVHGLPTSGCFVTAGAIVSIASTGYVLALRTLQSWRENV
ncbi:hypothetical protein [Novosphingobium sp.]|uniref:hypothetical protein n=1 Tax=Novosphingobium sp. TaxID=1874826 RepID=UPI0026051EB9|nr:hypothetical protein [Novosphingobium sp.]